MNCNDLLINIRETYKECDSRLEKNYRQEFESYSPVKLERVWEVIQENHNFAKAPELGNIFKYMNITGVSRTKIQGNYYQRCIEKKVDENGFDTLCNTKYSIKSKLCPTCNQKRTYKNLFVNAVEIVKCETMPNDVRQMQEICAICGIYKKNKLSRGVKCDAWGTHDNYKKTGRKCEGCPCFKCCNTKPSKAVETIESKKV